MSNRGRRKTAAPMKYAKKCKASKTDFGREPSLGLLGVDWNRDHPSNFERI